MSGLGLTFLRRGGQAHPTAGGDYIKFADDAVFNILMSKGISSDGVGITKDDAARVTFIPRTWFEANTAITEFSELRFFVNAQIEQYAFAQCSNLKKLDLSNISAANEAVCYLCTSLEDVGDISYLSTIGNHAFQFTKISGELLLRDVTTINQYSFARCVNLSKIILENATVIKGTMNEHNTCYGAFGACETVEEIVLPKIQQIGTYAFWNCTGAKKIHIGEFCTNMATGAFQNCNFDDFIIERTTPPSIANNTFVSATIKNLYVPDESVDAYKSATYWSNFYKVVKPISEYQG